jgi:hypothetical protein
VLGVVLLSCGIWIAKPSTQKGSQQSPSIPEVTPLQAFAVLATAITVLVLFKKNLHESCSHEKPERPTAAGFTRFFIPILSWLAAYA